MKNISAIVLAAGRSTRMGEQKMLMSWGDTTVLGRVIDTLRSAEVEEIILVTNSKIAGELIIDEVKIEINEEGDMLESLKAGLSGIQPSAEAVLICLGDQPQMEERSVRSVSEAFLKSRANLVVPSYNMRRGHPWLAARVMWTEIKAMASGKTLRDFLGLYASEIEYVKVTSPAILQDLDTPEDYLKYKPSV
ncbi:MAG: nucleotidyltransferase family protein [Anaerolineales bacterium]|nr:nucleotidyltransferase family protein [Anaerolineales bacterium]MCB9143842.1 nucleotidyltransferase family protein [Anaerolineales bacterium]